MNWKRGFVFLLVVAMPTAIWAGPDNRASEQAEIHKVFSNLTSAWAAGDGKAWGSAFLPDADFTVWFGLQLQGREAIAGGHQFIFDRFYRNTRYELSVRQIRFLSDSAAVVHLEGTVLSKGETMPGEPDSVPMAVVQKVQGDWKIAAFQNTPFAVEKYGRNGDLRDFKGRRKAGSER